MAVLAVFLIGRNPFQILSAHQVMSFVIVMHTICIFQSPARLTRYVQIYLFPPQRSFPNPSLPFAKSAKKTHWVERKCASSSLLPAPSQIIIPPQQHLSSFIYFQCLAVLLFCAHPVSFLISASAFLLVLGECESCAHVPWRAS